MNILISAPPESVEIEGAAYALNTDFRAALATILAFEDNELTMYEKSAVMLDNLYLETPPDLQAAFEHARWFLNGGEEDDRDESGPRLYSFSKDAALIFAAFRQTHGIDLQRAKMHWWAFLALFKDLGGETTFCGLVALRKRLKTGKATKEEREAAREMGGLIDVPDVDTRSLEDRERETEFFALVDQARAQREKEADR